VTAFILTQIILEEAKNKNVLLPVPLLHLLIQYGDTLLTEFFEKHLQQIIKSYIACKVSVDEQFVRWLDLSMNLTDAAQKTLFEMTPLKTILETFAESPAQKK
jgi:polyhydroxyalkanoate synthesis regulator protein